MNATTVPSTQLNQHRARMLNQLKLPFPLKLHRLLEEAEKKRSDHIVSWLPDGKAFKIHDPEQFCNTVMAAYFKQTKLKSFTRQVSFYVTLQYVERDLSQLKRKKLLLLIAKRFHPYCCLRYEHLDFSQRTPTPTLLLLALSVWICQAFPWPKQRRVLSPRL
jgi:hypothetical protein